MTKKSIQNNLSITEKELEILRKAVVDSREYEARCHKLQSELFLVQQQLSAIMNFNTDLIYFKDTQSRYLLINQAEADNLQLDSPERAIGETDFAFYPPAFAREAFADEEEIIRTGRPLVNKVENQAQLHPTNTWIITTKVPICNEQGEIVGIAGVSKDLSTQKYFEDKLNEHVEQFQGIFQLSEALSQAETIPAICGIALDYLHQALSTDASLVLLTEKDNPWMLSTSQGIQNPAEIASIIVSNWLTGKLPFHSDISNADDISFIALQSENIVGYQTIGVMPILHQQTLLGALILLYHSAHPLGEDERRIARTIANNVAVFIERHRAVEALADEKERLTVTLQSIGDGVITTDKNLKIVMINPAATKLTGWSPEKAVGKPLDHVFHLINISSRERYENPARHVLKSGMITGLANNTALISRDGIERLVSSTASPIRDRKNNIIGVVLVFRDITERKKKEEELLKASKLESIGILAGGIAHDFNNILTAMLMNISLAKMFADPNEKIFEILQTAEKASIRAKDLTQQLLTFSKGGTPIKRIVTIRDLILETASFALRGSNVRCEFFIPNDLWSLEVDEGQISQVFNNLIINANQAMPNGGIIRISCENVDIFSEETIPLSKGRYVRISIQDHGVGIQSENFQKIFDPYFSTKEKGSGLGLATAYAIIKNHNGLITLDSDLGRGTTFYIYLPASDRTADIAENHTQIPETPSIAKERILIMDDEDSIRQIVGKSLTHLGYLVNYAKDGFEAIALYRAAKERGKPFHLVIMDLTIPGSMGGKEAIHQLKEFDPQVKAIVSSGYSNDPVMSYYTSFGFFGCVAKPYHIQELVRTIQDVLAMESGGE